MPDVFKKFLFLFIVLASIAQNFFPKASYAQDTTPPSLIYSNPPNGAAGVSRALPVISFTFSEQMNRSGIDLAVTGDFPCTTSWSPDSRVLFLTRSNQPNLLAQGETLTFTLNGTSSHFSDMAGNPLPMTNLSFTVGSDTTIPSVLSSDPVNLATGISPNLIQVSITFSETMQKSTSFSSNFPDFTATWSSDQKTITITRKDQNTPLQYGTTYNFILNPEGYLNFHDLQYNYLPQTTISFTVVTAPVNPDAPVVTFTSPVNGETGVRCDLSQVIIQFNKMMNGGVSYTSNFPTASISWSSDRTTLILTRNDLNSRLIAENTYSFTLNPGTSTSFRDMSGNPLPQTVFSFTTNVSDEYELIKISASPEKGFEWPYYLSIPKTLSRNTTLLVEPNNTGRSSDDLNYHDTAALTLIKWRSDFAVRLGVPLLVPTFPRPLTPTIPGGIYTHALDRTSLTTEEMYSGKSIKRIDLQLIAMIRDAQELLTSRGFSMDKKIFMMGFSASGAFTSRFTMIHPEIIRAAAPGSPGGWPLAPVSEWWNGTTLRYPVGIADIESLTGKPFDLADFKKVPQYIYVGDKDTNDALDTRNFPQNEINVICTNLNCNALPLLVERWPVSKEMYESVGINNRFVIYPNVAHTITTQMFEDILQFFKRYKGQKSMPWLNLLLND